VASFVAASGSLCRLYGSITWLPSDSALVKIYNGIDQVSGEKV
jgi:hypothetical protein